MLSPSFLLFLVRRQPYIGTGLWPRWCSLVAVGRVVGVFWWLFWFSGGLVLLSRVAATVELLLLQPIGRRAGGSVARDLIWGRVGYGGCLVAGVSGFWWRRVEVGGLICGWWSVGSDLGLWFWSGSLGCRRWVDGSGLEFWPGFLGWGWWSFADRMDWRRLWWWCVEEWVRSGVGVCGTVCTSLAAIFGFLLVAYGSSWVCGGSVLILIGILCLVFNVWLGSISPYSLELGFVRVMVFCLGCLPRGRIDLFSVYLCR